MTIRYAVWAAVSTVAQATAGEIITSPSLDTPLLVVYTLT